jgi:hypothetical protein
MKPAKAATDSTMKPAPDPKDPTFRKPLARKPIPQRGNAKRGEQTKTKDTPTKPPVRAGGPPLKGASIKAVLEAQKKPRYTQFDVKDVNAFSEQLDMDDLDSAFAEFDELGF